MPAKTRGAESPDDRQDWTADVPDIPDPPFKDLLDVVKVEAKDPGRIILGRLKRQVIGWLVQKLLAVASLVLCLPSGWLAK